MENKPPTSKQQMKAAMNIELALSQMPMKKKLSEKEEKFRNALGVRLKIGKPLNERQPTLGTLKRVAKWLCQITSKDMNPSTNFFKITLIAFLVVLLYLLYRHSENGRYQQTAGSPFIIDTRTGKVVSDMREQEK